MIENFTEVEITHKNMDNLIKPFSDFGKRWALLTSGTDTDQKSWNTMTVAWGNVGVLWNKLTAIIYVRPTRFTHKFTEENKTMTLSFFDESENFKKVLKFCGSHSGKDCNKAEKTGLKPFKFGENFISFEQAVSILACKKLYVDKIRSANFLETEIIDKDYPKRDFHTVYICEIVAAYKK